MKIPQIQFEDSFFFQLLYLITSQFCYSQSTVVKNSILTDEFIVNAGIFNPLKKVNISAEGSIAAAEFIK